MSFSILASNFSATALLLCALFYADYALTIWGMKLYLAFGREHQVHEAYELNPDWRETVAQGRYWDRKLIRVFAVMVILAGLLWYVGWLGRELGERPPTSHGRLLMSQAAFAYRDLCLALVISRSLVLIGLHLRNIVTYSRYLRPEFVTGQTVYSAAFSYAMLRVHALTVALAFLALWLLQPTAVHAGFALGPVALALQVRGMERKHNKLAAAQTQQPGTEG